MRLKNVPGIIKPFLLLFFIIQIHNYKLHGIVSVSSTIAATNTSRLATLLNGITSANTASLSDFNNVVLSDSTYNSSTFIDKPTSNNSIFTKLNMFYTARTTQNASYLTAINTILGNVKSKNYFSSSEKTTVSGWYSTTSSEVILLNNFSTVLNNCTSPSALLNNVVLLSSYNSAVYQDYPSSTNSIFYKMQTFYQNRSAALQTDVTYPQTLLNLLNAALDKLFLTPTQKSKISGYIATVSNEKSPLDLAIINLKTRLQQYQNDPAGLNAYVITESTFNYSYFINYPSQTTSIYATLSKLFNNRETSFVTDKNYLSNLEKALANSKSKLFLAPSQITDVTTWDTVTNQDITLVANFTSALQAASTLDALNAIAQNSSYNRTLLQNHPNTTNSLFAKIQSLANQKPQSASDLTKLETLLSNVIKIIPQILTPDQKTSLTSVISTTITDKFQSLLMQYKIDPAGLYTYIISDASFNSTAFQNYPSTTNSIYTTLGSLYTNRDTSFATDKNFLTNLDATLIAASSKSFLTTPQQTDILNWDSGVKQDLTLLSNFQSALQYINSVDSLNALAQNTSYNRTLFQNYPDTTTNIFSKAQTYFNQRTQVLANLTKLQTTLKNILNLIPLTLTTPQKSTISSCVTTLSDEISKLSGSTTVSTTTPAVTATATQSSTTFVYDSSVYGQNKVVYNSSAWIVPTTYQGNFAIKFQAKGQKDLYVQLSPIAGESSNNVYHLIIGGDSNTSTLVQSSSSTSAVIIGTKIVGTGSMLTGGLPGDGSTWDYYWIKIVGNYDLSWGKGTTVGTNTIGHWTLSQQTTIPVQYFGFGSYSSVIQISGINIEGITTDSQNSLKSAFTNELTKITTLEAFFNLVNNNTYKQSFLQNTPSQSNSIFTQLKGVFDNRVNNYNSDTNPFKSLSATLGSLQNLFSAAATKDFLTIDQKNIVATYSNTLIAEKNLLALIDSTLSTLNSIDDLYNFIKSQNLNTPVLTDYPNESYSLFSKINDCFNARSSVINKNSTYYSSLSKLLAAVKQSAFLTPNERTTINSMITVVNKELTNLSSTRSTLTQTKSTASSTSTIQANKAAATTQQSQSPQLRKQQIPRSEYEKKLKNREKRLQQQKTTIIR